jgi:hypothetical protein
VEVTKILASVVRRDCEIDGLAVEILRAHGPSDILDIKLNARSTVETFRLRLMQLEKPG